MTASILIASAFQPERLARCLAAIPAAAPETDYEVIVVLNGAEPAMGELLRERFPAVRQIETPANIGFPAACNLARTAASGEHLVVLHDDAVPRPGWLDALTRRAAADPTAGAVGSVVLWPGGERVQLAGGVVYSNADLGQILFDQPTVAAADLECRPVDMCGSNSLLVRADCWDAFGGLDERLFPHGYVDITIGMCVRVLGYRVLCEPAAVVEHERYGSTVHGYQVFTNVRSRAHFTERWAERLATEHEPPEAGEPAALARAAARPAPAPPLPAPAPPPAPSEQELLEKAVRLAHRDVTLRRQYIEETAPLVAEHPNLLVEIERLTADRDRLAYDAHWLRSRIDGIEQSRWWRLGNKIRGR